MTFLCVVTKCFRLEDASFKIRVPFTTVPCSMTPPFTKYRRYSLFITTIWEPVRNITTSFEVTQAAGAARLGRYLRSGPLSSMYLIFIHKQFLGAELKICRKVFFMFRLCRLEQVAPPHNFDTVIKSSYKVKSFKLHLLKQD